MAKTKKTSASIYKRRKSKSSPTPEFLPLYESQHRRDPSPQRLKSIEEELNDFKSSISKATDEIMDMYNHAQSQMKSEQVEFGRDIQSWIRELQEQSRVTIELQQSRFNEIYIAVKEMVTRCGEYSKSIEEFGKYHTTVVAIHESGKIMEETSQLLDLHKKRYTAEIESRNKQITANDMSGIKFQGTPRNVKYVKGMAKLLVLLDGEAKKIEEVKGNEISSVKQ